MSPINFAEEDYSENEKGRQINPEEAFLMKESEQWQQPEIRRVQSLIKEVNGDLGDIEIFAAPGTIPELQKEIFNALLQLVRYHDAKLEDIKYEFVDIKKQGALTVEDLLILSTGNGDSLGISTDRFCEKSFDRPALERFVATKLAIARHESTSQ